MSAARVLIVEDEESIRFVLTRALEAEGHSVGSCVDGRSALAALESGEWDLAIIDIRLPDLSGLDLLSEAKAGGIEAPMLVMTAESTMANAIEAMKRGAFDYVTKPFDVDEMKLLVDRALEVSRLSRMVEQLKDDVRPRYTPGEGLVGSTPTMQEIYKTIGRVATSDASILLQGESGTGKELIARALHFHSGRTGAFVAINCSAIPRELLESELFGHERGAFTGAVQRQAGKFELAHRGTLFLDEIGEMPTDLQAKLLRVLQDREFTRVGGREPLRTDARILAATNRNLEAEVRKGAFREDLFFRLSVVPIHVPPLRERKGDIPELIRHFIAKINRDMDTRIVGLSEDAERLLLEHSWPGNVRELENDLVRASVLAAGRTLTAGDFRLPSSAGRAHPPAGAPFDDIVRDRVREVLRQHGEVAPQNLYEEAVSWVERPLLELILEHTGGNQLRAAEILGINRNTLRKKLTSLRIPVRR